MREDRLSTIALNLVFPSRLMTVFQWQLTVKMVELLQGPRGSLLEELRVFYAFLLHLTSVIFPKLTEEQEP